MEPLVDKIVEKYSEDLVRLFPLQKLFSTLMAVLILLMVKHGDYLSALESVFQLSLKDLFVDDGELIKIRVGLLFYAVGLISLSSFAHAKTSEKVSRFIANGSDLVALSNKLHMVSKRIELPIDAITVLANECLDRLENRKANLAKLSSLAEFLFMMGAIEITASIYGLNFIDLIFSVAFLLIWLVIRAWLVFRFISEILPLEAHLFGVRGIPYELNIK